MKSKVWAFPRWAGAIVPLFILCAGTELLAQTSEQLRARCSQLIAYYDRFGVGRSQNSDGRRNHTRISAEIDCWNGQYLQGMAIMEKLLVNKKFCIPPPAPTETEDED